MRLTRRGGVSLKSSVLLCLFAQLSQASQNRDLGTGPGRAHQRLELGRQVYRRHERLNLIEDDEEEEEEKKQRPREPIKLSQAHLGRDR